MGKKLLEIKVTKNLVDALKPGEGMRDCFYDWLQRINYEKMVCDEIWKLFDTSQCESLIGDAFYI